MPVHHSPKGRQKGKGKVGVAKTPTKSCVMDSGGNIVVTVDMESTDNTVEQQSVKVAAHQKADCEREKVAANQKAEKEYENESDPELMDDDGYQVKRTKRSRRGSPIKDGENENERKSVNVDQANPQKERKLNEKTNRTVYVKGRGYNLPKALGLNSAKAFKRAVQSLIGETDMIDAKNDSIRIVCKRDNQKQLLLSEKNIAGKEVVVSLPWSMSRPQKQRSESKAWEKGVITNVPTNWTIDDIKEETNAIWARRITKVVDSQFKPTGAVIIAYEEELPGAVYIGLTRYRVSVYVPTPTRCDKCQRFGHRADQCKSAELRCSRCGKNHEFIDCTVEKERAKCANCGENNSSAYRGCKKYREVKETLKVAATEKLSYADALKQKEQRNELRNQQQSKIYQLWKLLQRMRESPLNSIWNRAGG